MSSFKPLKRVLLKKRKKGARYKPRNKKSVGVDWIGVVRMTPQHELARVGLEVRR